LVGTASRELDQAVYQFQALLLFHGFIAKEVPFNESSPDHLKLLQKIWSVVYPQRPFEGASSEGYKDMGFQVLSWMCVDRYV